MKKLYMLFLLLPFAGFSQVIQFGDADVKAQLLMHTPLIDVNGDAEIDQQEAANATYIELYGVEIAGIEISSLEGLQYFTNIESLSIDSTNLTSFDLSFYPDLKTLNLLDNEITNIDLSSCPLLEYINLDFNPLIELDVQVTPLLEQLYVAGTNLPSLNLSNLTNLTFAQCQNNSFMINFNASGCTALTDLYFDGAHHVNLAGCSGLTHLEIGVYESLDISGCSGLINLYLVTYNLTSVDITDCSSLQHCTIIGENLKTAFLKNGVHETDLVLAGPELVYVCIDDSQIEDLTDALSINEQVPPIITSLCTSYIGDVVNVITGTVTLDVDADGCSDADLPMQFLKIKAADGILEKNVFTNASGVYSLYPNSGTYTLEPVFLNQSLFNVQSQTVTFAEDNGGTATVNFCLTAEVEISDADISVYPLGHAMPGFDAKYQIAVRNKGNQILNGSVALTYEESVLDYVSSVPAGETVSGAITWSLDALLPFETRTYNVVLNLNAPTETPPLNMNDFLTLSAEVITPADVNINDNLFELQQEVVSSFDPNDKFCVQGEIQPSQKIGDYLHYVINFENNGNAAAQFVRVTDEINTASYDLSSFELLSTSHNATTRLDGNIAEFMFENINLAPEEQGFVAFRIKSNQSLSESDTVSNQANIYFDFNFPILTNFASTTFAALVVNDVAQNSLVIYPNPVQDVLNISAPTDILSVGIYDVQGRQLEDIPAAGQTAQIDMINQHAGVYLIKVTTAGGIQVQKIIKN